MSTSLQELPELQFVTTNYVNRTPWTFRTIFDQKLSIHFKLKNNIYIYIVYKSFNYTRKLNEIFAFQSVFTVFLIFNYLQIVYLFLQANTSIFLKIGIKFFKIENLTKFTLIIFREFKRCF